MTEIVVTGRGIIAPNGTGTEPFWAGLLAASPVTATPQTAPDMEARVAEVLDAAWLEQLTVPPSALDRSAQLAVVAAGEALREAGLDGVSAGGWAVDPDRVAVVIGNGAGGQISIDEGFRRIYKDGGKRTHPLTVAKSMVSSSASWVSMAHRARGPTFVVSSACASGTHAIGIAAGMLKAGLADVVIAGGTEAPLNFGTVRAWESMRILAPDICRPFCKTRSGLTLGEGAGILTLETAEHARARGATVRGRLLGFSSCADAADIVAPTAEGMIRAMHGALADAGLTPEAIGYINAHGTGTLSNDRTEAAALAAVFAGEVPPTSSTKSVTGHGLGAAGAIEAVATLLALEHQTMPPTANHVEDDPECPIDCVPNVARSGRFEAALSNSFAFGGLNACLVFGRA